MKTILNNALLVLLLNTLVFAQSGWVWLNPLPQGNYLYNVSFLNDSLVYVSGNGGTLMKSNNGGINFSFIQTGIRDALSLTFLNELTGFSPAGNGVLRTIDGGFNWQYFHILNEHTAMQIQFVSNSTLFVLMNKGQYESQSSFIYKSTDLGISWNVSLVPTIHSNINAMHFINTLTGYAVGLTGDNVYPYNSKIYKTNDGGLSWDSVASNLGSWLDAVYFLDVFTGFTTMSYAAVATFFKTTNSGISWDTVFSQWGSSYDRIKFFNSSEGFMGSAARIAKTTNGGLNWQVIGIGSIFLNDINLGIVLNSGSGGGGTYYYNNFISRTTNSGLNMIAYTHGFWYELTDVYFINESTGFLGSYNNKILKTTDAGFNWSEYTNNDLSVENIQFVNENTGYAGLSWGKIAKTTNCGVNWEIIPTGNPDHNHGLSFPSADTGYSVTKYGYCLKTTNGGNYWFELDHQSYHGYGDIYFINNNTGVSGGDSFITGILRKTTDGGLNWKTSRIDSTIYIWDVQAASEDLWFAGGQRPNQKGIIGRSTDSGLNWTSTPLPTTITAIFFPTVTTGYASTFGGVIYKTTNSGSNWFATECINAIESYGMYFMDNYAGFAVTSGGGVIKTTTGGGNFIGINPISSEVARHFILHQNYPNPFNPVTRIKIQVAGNTTVKLTIYDVIGREITTLVNEQLQPGVYEVEWDGTNYPSGVYLYRLTTSDFTQTKKMVLLK